MKLLTMPPRADMHRDIVALALANGCGEAWARLPETRRAKLEQLASMALSAALATKGEA